MNSAIRKQSKKLMADDHNEVYDPQAVRPSPVPTSEISVINYSPRQLVERHHLSIEECFKLINNESITWINIEGPRDPALIAAIGREFKLHPLVVEDISVQSQRSKLDYYPGTIFIVTHALFYWDAKSNLNDEQVILVFGDNYLISFVNKSCNLFERVQERIRNPESRTRKYGSDYLCYAIIDTIVDHYFLTLDICDQRLIAVEHDLIYRPSPPKELHRLQVLKRDIILLRKAVWPMREVISQFRRLDVPLVTDTTILYMHDVYDHTIQAIDTIESFRDVASGLLDVYLSTINQRLNEIMKVLTIVSTIFVPLTFIASLYGMNIEHIPELHWKYAYPTVLAVMAFIVACMLYFFKRKQWL
jgi:magnesium transporter